MTHTVQYPENEGKVAVFDTEEEAIEAQNMCFLNHMANHVGNPQYTASTTSWAIPRQRIDGKWDFPVCHHSDISEATNIEEYDINNYPVEESP